MIKLAIFSLMAVAAPENVDVQEPDANEVTSEQMDKVLSKLEQLSKEIEDQVSALEEQESDDLESVIEE